jgi:copper chaperone
MKRIILISLLMFLSFGAFAANTQYLMRVDGLACPYCAYGIEKKLSAIDGVQEIDVDLNTGVVQVDVADGVVLEEAAMKQLFRDAGFTFRSMKISNPEQAKNQE